MRSSTVFVVSFCLLGRVSGQVNSFDQCKIHVERILNGTETHGPINNETIEEYGYIYHGPVAGINPDFPRPKLLTITREGCQALCGLNDPDYYWVTDISLTLSIVSNWVIPIIALLAVFPYESSDGSNRKTTKLKETWAKALRTSGHLLNWLGSPQTALTAVFFNIEQMRMCLSAAKRAETDPEDQCTTRKELKRDAYYVLCCIGQYQLPENADCFLDGLLYSLFRPLCKPVIEEHDTDERRRTAEAWTTELLCAMARQMRASRRRGVWPTFASIILFFVAYGVSVALAFSNDMGDRTTTHSLAYGILISWLPLLVLFAILDRNPNSAERTRTLIFRWMWNGRVVKAWENDLTMQTPNWWSPAKRKKPQAKSERHQNPKSSPDRRQTAQKYPQAILDEVHGQETSLACSQQTRSPPAGWDCIPGRFIGQGREIGYNGLAYAVVSAVSYKSAEDLWRLINNRNITRTEFKLLFPPQEHRPPMSWWILSMVSLLLVLFEIGMAVMMSSTVPTVGVGCRSGLYIIYALLNTGTWILHLFPWFRRQGFWAKVLGYGLCLLATLCLTVTTFASFSGVLKNCICRAGFSGYLDFEDAEFYRKKEHFDVTKWWWIAAILGAFPVVLFFLIAVLLMMLLQPLWQEDTGCEWNSIVAEESGGREDIKGADMKWLD